jgi:photosystem II stability/assembly factor-like uncharacterized protein
MKNILVLTILIASFISCKKTSTPSATPSPSSPTSTNTWVQMNSFTNINSLINIGTDLFLATNNHGMYKSIDNGTTWSPTNNGLGSDTLNCEIFANGSTLYLSTWKGQPLVTKIFQSTNNGTNWTQIWTNAGIGSSINKISFFGSNILIATAGNSYKSSNNGVSWSQISTTTTSILSFISDGTNIFCCDPFNTHKSIDNGSTFSLLVNDSLNSKDFARAASIGNNIYVASTSGSGVYKSSNSGLTWAPANNGLLAYYGTNLKYFITSLYSDGANLYAGTGISKVLISTNSGTSWTLLGGVMPGSSSGNNYYIKSILVNSGYTYAIVSSKGLFRILN